MNGVFRRDSARNSLTHSFSHKKKKEIKSRRPSYIEAYSIGNQMYLMIHIIYLCVSNSVI